MIILVPKHTWNGNRAPEYITSNDQEEKE